MTSSTTGMARLQATIGAGLALALWLWLRGPVATAVLALAGALAALAWFAPRAHAPIHRVLTRGAHAFAVGVSWILLGVAYLGLFVPLRAWRWIARQDPLALHRDPRRATFLRELPPPRPGRFERMY